MGVVVKMSLGVRYASVKHLARTKLSDWWAALLLPLVSHFGGIDLALNYSSSHWMRQVVLVGQDVPNL